MKFGTEEFAMHCVDMAAANPNGFRNPGRHGTSLVEQAMLACGMTSPEEIAPPPSKRGGEKRANVKAHKARFAVNKLMGLESRDIRDLIGAALRPHDKRKPNHGRSKVQQSLWDKAYTMAIGGQQVTMKALVV